MSNGRSGILFVVSAPSGAGKTSLVKALIERSENLSVCVSHTTRERRASEADGVNYHFTDVEHFKAMIAEDEFLEWAEVFGNYYGTSRSSVAASLKSGVDLILEIDYQGAEQVRRTFPEAVSMFILPPSRQVLEERLRGRAQDSADVIARRLSQAVKEMSHHNQFDYLVVNDDFDTAVDDLSAIVRTARLTCEAQRTALKDTLASLLDTGTAV